MERAQKFITVCTPSTHSHTLQGLPPAHRPQEWKSWTVRGRKGAQPYHIMPAISNVKEFGLACINWWHMLQPSFQHNEHGSMPLPNLIRPDLEGLDDEWELLRKGGPNGLVMVLLLFTWWGQKAQNAPEVIHQWHTAMVDLRHVLEAMGTTAQKRTSCSSATLQPSNKRQKHK